MLSKTGRSSEIRMQRTLLASIGGLLAVGFHASAAATGQEREAVGTRGEVVSGTIAATGAGTHSVELPNSGRRSGSRPKGAKLSRRSTMKSPSIVLAAFILAVGICAGIFLLRENQILARQSVQRAEENPSTGQTRVKNAWSIGIYAGPSPFQLSAPANIKNPVITAEDVTDLNVNIVAHPFMVVKDSLYYLFFTAKNDLSKEYSGIGLAENKNGFDWRYRQIVLKEPFVLSYPYVFRWQDNYYLIPEAHAESFVRLYRAIEFPYRWTYEKDLITGDHFISASVVHYADMW
jgi:hypothetical protein